MAPVDADQPHVRHWFDGPMRRCGSFMNAEFSVAGSHSYNRSGPVRWLISHVWRFKWYAFGMLFMSFAMNMLNSYIPLLTGQAFDAVLESTPDVNELGRISLIVLVVVLARGALDLGARFCTELCANGVAHNIRDELFLSLLGKSQTFHNRQKVGDLMARTANDVRQISFAVNPGFDLLFDSMLALVLPIAFIAFLDWRLLPAPILFAIGFYFTLKRYMRELNPVSVEQREAFAALNASLAESVQGIEVIKVTAQEPAEQAKFIRGARRFRTAFVEQGRVQSRYLPTLVLTVCRAIGIAQGIWFVTSGRIGIGELVAFIALMGNLGFPAEISTFTFQLVQMGTVSAKRVLGIMAEQTELDENTGGHVGAIKGSIVFDNVTFAFEDGVPLVRNLSFEAKPGETIAIVGETGSGKSTMTKLINRIYDPSEGRILIDGIDAREWNLDSLRSQISSIEQEVMLFSRPISENIAFSLGQQSDPAAIERAARDAQAHGFISELPEGYNTVIGERGVTLSGGQRQRLAIARALLTDPAILILDDSTSAVDSATEDEIQRAIHRVLEGRTTILITHRLSQIRWADRILVMRKGEAVDFGTHEELMARCALYGRIYGFTDLAVPATASAEGN
jgi:ATP-binding cassette subfamily B protein